MGEKALPAGRGRRKSLNFDRCSFVLVGCLRGTPYLFSSKIGSSPIWMVAPGVKETTSPARFAYLV